MIRSLITVVAGLLALSAASQDSFVIKGKIDSRYDGQTVKLDYTTGNREVKDSSVVRDGTFSFKGKTVDITKAFISLADSYQELFLENRRFTIDGPDLASATIKGGPAQADYRILTDHLQPLNDKRKPLINRLVRALQNKNDTGALHEVTPQLKTIDSGIFRVQNTFIHQHPDSYVSLFLLDERSGDLDPAAFEPFFNALSQRIRNTSKGRRLTARLKIAKATDIGQKAFDFTQNDTAGASVSLSSLKGKYVLIDFWASWCSPCRAENPDVVKAYQKFKDRNFEIIGISLDSKKEPWLKAIATDSLPWIQVSDLKGWQNAVAVKYGVTSVPRNFLLGPDGTIIAKNLRGEELENELEKILGLQ